MNESLLSILVCPESKQPVRLVEQPTVDRINKAIRGGALKNQAGKVIEEEMDGALVRLDGVLAYPIRDDIPVMLVEEAFALPRE